MRLSRFRLLPDGLFEFRDRQVVAFLLHVRDGQVVARRREAGIQFQRDPALFDPVGVWYGTENGQSPNGGIEDEGDCFRWLFMSFRP